MLYAGTGDGGGGGDPAGNAQNKHALLGKLLRLDVDGASGYAIPASNPFASDTSYAGEIWSLGLRNPWRFSFDAQTGDLYIADVGQGSWEEINVSPTAVQAGRAVNWGWNVMEAHHCYPFTPCDSTGFVQPVYEYAHSAGACSITGGYVYRGSAMPGLRGEYLFADFCTGFVGSIKYPTRFIAVDWSVLLSPAGNLSSFGQDAKGELYIMTLNGGVYKIVPSQ
jgi:glucose/arabinose dehydrogenase